MKYSQCKFIGGSRDGDVRPVAYESDGMLPATVRIKAETKPYPLARIDETGAVTLTNRVRIEIYELDETIDVYSYAGDVNV